MLLPIACEPLESRTLLSLVLATNPPLTTGDNGGPILADPHVALVFWGGGWSGSPVPSVTQVQMAAQTVLTSRYTYDLSAYRAALGGGGSIYGSYFVTSTSPPAQFTTDDMLAMLQSSINAGALPRPTVDNHLLYMVIPQAGSNDPSELLGGFHSYDLDNQNNRFYYGWTVNDGTIDTISYYLSHEIVEAMTDPDGTAIQVNPRDPVFWNEVSDGPAQAYTARLNGFLMQSYWLQSKNAYVIGTGAQDISNVGGHLVINGDQLANKNDTITVTPASGGGINVNINGESFGLIGGSVNDITLSGLTGNDTIRIQASQRATVNGGDGTDAIHFDGNDSLLPSVLLPSGGDDSVFLNSASVTVNASQRLGALTVGINSTFVVSPGGSKVLTVTGVTVGIGAVLDLNDNDMIVDYPTGSASPQGIIQTDINNGRSSSWYGPGIISTAARMQLYNTTLGVLSASQYKSIYGPAATFAGQTIDNSAVLIKYTYYGDADFNGIVNFDDYSRIDSSFGTERTGWLNGDFDGNGNINFDDYALIDLAFNTQSIAQRTGRATPRGEVKSARLFQLR
ncbi:hypothetical protein BH09PLA1_BH09PLA1_29910 [soil metagenome]